MEIPSALDSIHHISPEYVINHVAMSDIHMITDNEWTPDEPLFREFLGHDKQGTQVLVTVWQDGSCWVQYRDTRFSPWQAPIRCRFQ